MVVGLVVGLAVRELEVVVVELVVELGVVRELEMVVAELVVELVVVGIVRELELLVPQRRYAVAQVAVVWTFQPLRSSSRVFVSS